MPLETFESSTGSVAIPANVGDAPAVVDKATPSSTPKSTPQSSGEKLSMQDFEGYNPSEPKNISNTPPLKTDTARDINNRPPSKDANEPLETSENLEDEAEDKEGDKGEEVEELEDGELDKVQDETIKDNKDKSIHGNDERNYEGFSDEEKKILKRLDNPRFGKITTHWRALKQAAGKSIELAQELVKTQALLKEGGVPQNWHEHPDAYQLSPEFRNLTSQFSQAEMMERHYENQLLNIKQGKPWQSITGWEPKSGQPIYSQPYEASEQAEIWANRQMLSATNNKGVLDGRARSLQEGFKTQHEQASGLIKKEVDDTISRMHPDLKPQDADVQAIAKALPKVYANHPLAYGYGQLGSIILQQGRLLKKLMGDQQQASRLKQDKIKAGPRANKQVGAAASGNGGDKLSIKDFLPKEDI